MTANLIWGGCNQQLFSAPVLFWACSKSISCLKNAAPQSLKFLWSQVLWGLMSIIWINPHDNEYFFWYGICKYQFTWTFVNLAIALRFTVIIIKLPGHQSIWMTYGRKVMVSYRYTYCKLPFLSSYRSHSSEFRI